MIHWLAALAIVILVGVTWAISQAWQRLESFFMGPFPIITVGILVVILAAAAVVLLSMWMWVKRD